VKERAAGLLGNGLLAGVDQVVVFLPLGRRRAHAQHAVFGMQNDFTLGGQVVGHQRGQADAQVDIGALGDVLRDAGGDLVAGQFAAHCCSLAAGASICTTRLTKMPGVTMFSGSSSPSSTISRTCATATRAALAMMGPKLRAVLRYTRLPQRSPRSALIRA